MERVTPTWFGYYHKVQKEQYTMQRPEYYLGIDIASKSFYAAVGKAETDQWQLLGKPKKFENEYDSLSQFLNWIEQNQLKPGNTIICMEATGVYNEVLAHFLVANGYELVIQSPLEVKRAFKPIGHKTDPVDSQQIAEYAYRFFDELRLWEPREEILEQIKTLLATREQLCKQKVAHLNAYKALRRKTVRTPLAEFVHEKEIALIRQHITEIEQEIERLIDQDPTYRQFIGLLMSVPGVGLLLAANLLITYQDAPQQFNPKSLAAFVGICPFEHKSGSSLSSTPTSRHYGPPALRRLLFLAAMSVRTHQPQFRLYFMRKIQEGKAKRLVINNIENKLLKIICAVIRTKTPYIQGYRSVHPYLLKPQMQLT